MGAGISVGAGTKKKGSGIGGPRSKGMFAFLKQMDKKGKLSKKPKGAGVKRGGMHMMRKASKKAMFQDQDWWKTMSKTAIRNVGKQRRAAAKSKAFPPAIGVMASKAKAIRAAKKRARR